MHKELGPPRSTGLRTQQGQGYVEPLSLEEGENKNKGLVTPFCLPHIKSLPSDALFLRKNEHFRFSS